MRLHPSGNYVVEGRKKDLINRGGEKISAEEIENLILPHPAVQNVACVPMPDPDLGERMCACVILRPGERLTLAELVGVPQGEGDRQVQAAGAARRSSTTSRCRRSARCRRRRSAEMVGSADATSSTCTAIPAPRNGSRARVPTSRRSPSTGTGGGSARARTRSSGTSPTPGVEAVLVALDLETTIATPPVTQRVRARDVEAPPAAHHPGLGRGRARQGRDRDRSRAGRRCASSA